MKIKHFIYLLLLLTAYNSHAGLQDFELFIDSSKTVTKPELLDHKYDKEFHKVSNGYTTKNEAFNYIVKFYVLNNQEHGVTKHIRIPNTLFSKILLLHKDRKGNTVEKKRGYMYNDSTGFGRANFSVITPPKDSVLVYLIVESMGTTSIFNILIEDETEFTKANEEQLLFHGVFYGFLIFLIIINMFYYFTMKNTIFLIYSISIFFCFGFNSFLDSIFFLGITPSLGIYHLPIGLFFIVMHFAFLPTMAFHYLKMDNKKFIKLKRVIYSYLSFAFIASIVPFILTNDSANEFFYFYYAFIVLICFPILLIVSIKGRNLDPILGRNFLIAYSILLFFSISPFLESLAGLNLGIGYFSFKIGTFVELTILSFTLALQFKRTDEHLSLVKLEHMNLQEMFFRSQINPHFLFNVLGSIDNYIINNKKKEASEYLRKFGKLIRLVLESTTQDKITLKDELEMIQTYIDLEQLRNDDFDFELRVDETISLEETKIPAMLVQPYIENAIKHGISSIKEKGLISLSIYQTDNLLKFIIEDNGVGIETSKKTSSSLGTKIGMKNTNNRINTLKKKLGIDFEVIVKDKTTPEQGTIVSFEVPI